MPRRLLLNAALLAILVFPAQAAPRYRLVDLGFVPGGNASVPSRFGPGGQIVGWSGMAGTFGGHATRWQVAPNGDLVQTTDLLGLPQMDWSSAYAMNASGWIVGHSNTAEPQPRAILWRDGQVVDIERGADGNANVYAFGLNDAGVICGMITKSGGGGGWDAVIWNERANQPGRFDHTFLPLHPLGDSLFSWTEAQSIDASGRVFGRSNLGLNGDRATLWLADAVHTPVLLEPLEGSQQSMPGQINEAGDAVGYTMYPFGLSVATRWSRDASHTPSALPAWPGHNACVATVVNPAGDVVLGASTLVDIYVFPWTSSDLRVLMWNSEGQWDLGQQLDASGAGWSLTGANDINAAGWILATATQAGVQHAVLLVPVPENLAVGTPAPRELALAAPQPNPARGAVRLGFTLAREAEARLDILDTQGRLVARVFEGSLSPGQHDRVWNGCDSNGRTVEPGIYHVSLTAAGQRATQRLARVR